VRISSKLIKSAALGVPAISLALITSPASYADEADDTIEQVIVTGVADRQLLLDARTDTGSRLGLTARETPAIVDILSERQIAELGARTNVEALNRAPGVTSSLPATSPGAPTMRGFSGGAVGLLYDGMRVASPLIYTRASDSFMFERIEILKGPASVLYGEGALAGAINLVPKRAILDEVRTDALASYGSYDSIRLAGDVNVPLGERAALRGVAAHGRSAGYVHDTDSEFFASSLSATLKPTDRLLLEFAADYSEDDYQTADLGTPLVPRAIARDPSSAAAGPGDLVIDRALRKTNFNVTDAILDSDTLWLRSRVRWEINDALTFSNEFGNYRSDRRFINAEIFNFNRISGLIDRSTGIVTHDIEYTIERPMLSGDITIGGLRNRFAIGAEASSLSFATRRYFATTTSVDLFEPVRGTFPGGTSSLQPPNQTSDVDVAAVFFENAIDLTSRWMVAGGMRRDWIDLDRLIVNAPAFKRDYSALSYRLGTVYDLAPKTQLFAQYSKAVAPIGNLLSLSIANSRFDLTEGNSVEAGVKSSFWDERVDVTFAGYRLVQDDIITRDPSNPALSVQGGRQSSRGVELSLSAAVTSELRIDANYTKLDAQFDELIEAGGISREGKTPPRIPETIANLFAFYSFEALPVTVSAGLRHAGRFYTDNANTIRARGYTTIDAAIGYRVSFGEITLRGRNLSDEFYVDYSDVSTTQFQVGAPRTVEIALLASF
jgi:iron complex outermembrane receptor protein